MRSSAFFNGDVASKAEEIAYPLAEDFGLTEDQAAALARHVEAAIHGFFATAREHELNLMNERTRA